MLQFLAARATPGVESVAVDSYCRSISLNGKSGHFAVSLDHEKNALEVHLHFGDPRSLFFIIERIRAMFDLNADWAVIAKTLCSHAVLARLAEGEEGLRIP